MAPQAWPAVFRRGPRTAPKHLCERKPLLFFYSEAAGRFCSKRNKALRGEELPAAGPARAGTQGREEPAALGAAGPRPPGRDPAAAAAQAERVCLGRRRQRASGRRPAPDVSSRPCSRRHSGKQSAAMRAFPFRPRRPAQPGPRTCHQARRGCGTGGVRGITLR